MIASASTRADGPGSEEVAVGFLDLAGYTAMTVVHGDESAADVAERFATLVGAALRDGDELVKTVGDGALVLSATEVALTALVGRICASLDAEPAFPVLRVGLHAGPVVRRGHDVFGGAVNTAARVAALAAGGQVLATHRLVRALEGAYPCRLIGPVELRGLPEAVVLHDLELCPAPHERQVDPVCGMAVLPSSITAQLRRGDRALVFCSEACLAQFLQTRPG